MKKKTVYFSDSINDDFFNFGKKYNKIKFDKNYEYVVKGNLKKFASFCLYYFFYFPFLWFYMYIVQGVKIKGKENIKNLKNTGYMVVGNHTHYLDLAVLRQYNIYRSIRRLNRYES